MTQTPPNDLDQPVLTNDDDETSLTAPEIEQFRREETFATGEHSTPDPYPRLTNLSVGFIKRAIVRPVQPARPEYLTIPLSLEARPSDGEATRNQLAVAEWDMLWEAGQFRRRFFDEDDLNTRSGADC